MNSNVRIGICGYGNLGKGVELAAQRANDIDLVGIFTRREPSGLSSRFGNKIYSYDCINDFADDIDVMVICTGSKTDLMSMTPRLTEKFNTVDSFDTHKKIREHFENVDDVARKTRHVSMISCGWDPGLFSLARIFFTSFLPDGNSYTFWGKGVSQGHSEALRSIEGVIDAKEYTIPDSDVVARIKNGNVIGDTSKYHIRECFVVCSEDADIEKIYNEIINMPDYFKGQKTVIHFVSAEEMKKNHNGMPHGGEVLRIGKTSDKTEDLCKLALTAELPSNPEFTGSVLCACARAVKETAEKGDYGCKTMFDVPPRFYLNDQILSDLFSQGRLL